MARFMRGDIVVVPFPFSAVPGTKRRPALVLVSWPFYNSTDYLLCMISSQNAPDPHIVPLSPADIEEGSLNKTSFLRPTYLFAVDEALIIRRIARLKHEKVDIAIEQIRSIL